MKKTIRYQTKNGAYTCGRKIDVKGLLLHSYGCPQPDPNVLAERWDKAGTSACVHAHIGKDEVIVTLPCEETPGKAARGWHAGVGKSGSANNTHLSAEMTEPSTIKYVSGANWVELADGTNTKTHVFATYANAVELFAGWCVFHKLDPLADGVILSHKEACGRGIASSHSDPEHIWRKFGLSMDKFRQDVKAAMSGYKVDFGAQIPEKIPDTESQRVKVLNGTIRITYAKPDGMNLRQKPDFNAKVEKVAYEKETFIVVGVSEDEKWYKLDNGLYISASPSYVKFTAAAGQKASTAGTGYYRVRKDWSKPQSQIGAFKALENAISLAKSNPGYVVYDNGGKQVYPV